MIESLYGFLPSGGYEITRFVFLRILGICYFFAFLSLVKQLKPLLGKEGLTPAHKFLHRVGSNFDSKKGAFWNLPTLFWYKTTDRFMVFFAWLGLLLSIALMLGFANVPTMFLLWFIYLSFVHIGQVWYGYGWESQLLETGFIGIFMVPLISLHPFPAFTTPILTIFLLKWLAFRIFLGAGLIKMRADPCWKKLTCLFYHFETQPLPNPFSRFFHFLPEWMLKGGVLFTHFVQIVVPFFIFWPQESAYVAGGLMILLQVILMISGNLSFLNLITIAPIIACFDDRFFMWLYSLFGLRIEQFGLGLNSLGMHAGAETASALLFVAVLILSIGPVRNLFSSNQVMNTSFDQFHLVNTYGAFGSVGRERFELVVQGTHDDEITANTEWKEYEFLGKPTDVTRTPPIIAPYQPRIDWQIWFAAMQSPLQNQWMFLLLWKLLHNDRDTLKLLKKNPFGEKPPTHVRIEYYKYWFAKPGEGVVWHREYVKEWLPPASKQTLKKYIYGYL